MIQPAAGAAAALAAPEIVLLRDLVRHPNATPDEVQAFIRRGVYPHLEGATLDVLRRDAGGNLIALRQGTRPAAPPLVLVTYAADYPPDDMPDPYEPRVVEGEAYGERGPCIWGRGTCEHKGALAAALHAFVESAGAGPAPQRTLMFLTLASGESGTHDAVARVFGVEGYRPGPAIIARNTGNGVGLGNKGSMSLELHVHGQTAHSSDPRAGHNAIEAAFALLGALQAETATVPPDPHLGPVALVPTNVSSDPEGVHAVPRACRLFMMRRVLPAEDPQAVFQALAGTCEAAGARLELHGFQYGAILPPEAWLARVVSAALATETGEAPICYLSQALDAGYFIRRGVEALCFGPGSARLAHTATDLVSVPEVTASRRVYAAAIRAAAQAPET
jgi:acetylornithine deacetylase/succinyl-diaminopimelate desuccinylase-like protein